MFLASAGLASTGPPDAITGVMACATLGLTASVVVILRVPQWRASVLPCVLLLMLPAGMLLWSMYARVTGLSAASRAAICALPAGGIALYLRALLRQGHDFGMPAVACPGRRVRRWICCAIAFNSLAIGWARVWCYPEGLVVSLSSFSGFEWYFHWLLSSLSGCSMTLLWWQAMQRSAQIARDPSRWKEGWAWWSLPHRQYLLFLMLLLTPLLRLAGHVGALLSDASSPLTEEPVGMLSPLLAVCALSVFFLGLDYDEEAALEDELLQQMRRCARARMPPPHPTPPPCSDRGGRTRACAHPLLSPCASRAGPPHSHALCAFFAAAPGVPRLSTASPGFPRLPPASPGFPWLPVRAGRMT